MNLKTSLYSILPHCIEKHKLVLEFELSYTSTSQFKVLHMLSTGQFSFACNTQYLEHTCNVMYICMTTLIYRKILSKTSPCVLPITFPVIFCVTACACYRQIVVRVQ